jgi:hypothetical protein
MLERADLIPARDGRLDCATCAAADKEVLGCGSPPSTSAGNRSYRYADYGSVSSAGERWSWVQCPRSPIYLGSAQGVALGRAVARDAELIEARILEWRLSERDYWEGEALLALVAISRSRRSAASARRTHG